MKTNLVVVLVILGVLVFGGIWISNSEKSGTNTPEKTCSNQDGYCVYDVGEFMKYSSPQEEADPSSKINPGDYFLDFSSLTEIPNLVCKDNGENPEIFDYFYGVCEEGSDGCGHERKAIICGQNYFVYDFTGSYGPRYYGPFEFLEY